MRYAVIDISASSLSLLVADINGELTVQFTDRETLSVLHYAEGESFRSAASARSRKA